MTLSFYVTGASVVRCKQPLPTSLRVTVKYVDRECDEFLVGEIVLPDWRGAWGQTRECEWRRSTGPSPARARMHRKAEDSSVSKASQGLISMRVPPS